MLNPTGRPQGNFSDGDIVQVHGLRGRADLNGRHVVLVSWDDDEGRFGVRLAGGERVAIRPANLRHFPPTMDVLAELIGGGASSSSADGAGHRETVNSADMKDGGPDELDWRMEDIEPGEVGKGAAVCLEVLRRRSVPADGEWCVFVRRARCWMGDDNPRTKRRRMWFIIIAREPDVAHCYIVDGPVASDLRSPIHHSFVCACVASVVNEVGRRPESLLCCPLGVAAFRPRDAESLAASLAPLGIPVGAAKCSEMADDAPQSITGLGLDGPTLRGVKPTWLAFMELLECEVEEMEEKLNDGNGCSLNVSFMLGGYHESYRNTKLPGKGVNTAASISSLRNLFEASKDCHDRAPWEVLSNEQYLHVQDEKTGEEAFVLLSGHTDYTGRGLNICETLADLQRFYDAGGRGTGTLTGWLTRLQWVRPELTSFGTLDDIAALDLPLTDEPLGENIPLWYRTREIPAAKPAIEGILPTWNSPPPHEQWGFLAAIARATARFASDPDLVRRGPGFSPVRFATSPVSLEGLVVTGGTFDT